MSEKFKNYINNNWVDPITEKYFKSTNPADTSLRVVLKPNREEKLILPPGYIKDY